ncbi:MULTISPECIES: hypothetical protein [Streptomyces]|uniref:MFS transporter n=1 Tax=Streptomyces mirabilis TaxID=68239 RepID=A0ABU3V0Z3_9ACTN|nr:MULTISPECIES: hypothetical protein [Streptomyces]MCX4616335.1 hypothetical protein [Streptomyces mirabilis]MCX5346903.1 hypothetical protein [Streptomyces mirabilis]MDU8999758.1 hypothetical protein [Streptomyces mirabilis]
MAAAVRATVPSGETATVCVGSTLVPDRQQGTAQGLYQGATGAAVLLAGLWAGLAWGADGHVPLLASGAAALTLAAALPLLGRFWQANG